MSVGVHNGESGVATNRGGVEFLAHQDGASLLTRRWEQSQLQGSELHEMAGQAMLPSSFSLAINAWQSAYAKGIFYNICNPYYCDQR